jgi:glucokinase
VTPEPPGLGDGPAVLAVDVGGTTIKSGLIDATGRIHGLVRTPLPEDRADPAAAIVREVGRLASRHRTAEPGIAPAAIGVSVPGIVDERAGVALFSSNLGWRDAPFRELLGAELDLPVAFGHDVRAAGEAELRLGAGRGCRDVVVAVIGTGIAGTIIMDGRPRAADGWAGEIGHMLSALSDEPCPCGAIGCLETVASAGAIARRYAEAVGPVVDGAREVAALASAGDPVARRVWDLAVEALAQAFAQVTSIVGPQRIVVGGGLAEAGAQLFDPLRARVDALLSFHRRPEIVRARLGDDAGFLGTAMRARELAGWRS